MKQLKLFGLIVIFFSLIACGQAASKKTQSQPSFPNDWSILNKSNYTIQYPDSFELNNSGEMGMTFILLSNQTSQEDLFRENINLVIQDLSGHNIDLDKYVEVSEEQINQMITNANIIESKRIKTSGSEYQKVIYTGSQGQFNLKFMQYYWVIKQQAYVLTLTCELDQFDKYYTISEKIMDSFKIK